jgi:hypothetical protein
MDPIGRLTRVSGLSRREQKKRLILVTLVGVVGLGISILLLTSFMYVFTYPFVQIPLWAVYTGAWFWQWKNYEQEVESPLKMFFFWGPPIPRWWWLLLAGIGLVITIAVTVASIVVL